MGATQGTLSYKIFYVRGDLPRDIRGTFLPQIQEHAFIPLTPEDEEDERYGWVVLDSPLCYDFNTENVFMNNFLNLCLRFDKYVIPGKTFSARVQQMEQEYKEEHGKHKLTKFELEDIKELVAIELKRQMLPRMTTIDMSWDLSQNRIRFWNQSTRMCDYFQGFFHDTFGLDCYPAGVHNTVVQSGFSVEDVTDFVSASPAKFTDGIPGVDF